MVARILFRNPRGGGRTGDRIKRPAFAGLSERHLPFPRPSPHYFFVLLPEAGTVDGVSTAS
jgi:hypothetical protein